MIVPNLKNRCARKFDFNIGTKEVDGKIVPNIIGVIPGDKVTPVSDADLEKLYEIPLFNECLVKEEVQVIGGSAPSQSRDVEKELAEMRERLRAANAAKVAAEKELEAEKEAKAKAEPEAEAEKTEAPEPEPENPKVRSYKRRK